MTALLDSKAHVLVTGGAGFIGSHVTAALAQRGHSVRVLDDFSTGSEENLKPLAGQVEIIRGSILDENLLKKSLAGCACIFHLAAIPSVPRSVRDPVLTCEVNILGSLKLFESARALGIKRIVLSSSSSVYGESAQLPKHEDLLPSPLSPYAASKISSEYLAQAYCHSYGLEILCLRYFNVYGPNQNPDSEYAAVIPVFLKALMSGTSPTIYGDGEQTRDFTYIDDVVAANLLAASAPQGFGTAINICGGKPVTINHLVELLGKIARNPFTPNYAPPRLGDIRDSYASCQKAREILNWQPATSIEEGLIKTHQWFTHHFR